MSSTVKSYDRRTGVTYIYESHSFWDPVKKRPSAHRHCIGKLDPVTGEIVPTGRPGRPRKVKGTDTSRTTCEPASCEEDSSREAKKLQKQLLESLSRIQELEARLKTTEDEKRHLEHKVRCLTTTLETLKKAFANHCSAFEDL